MPRQSKRSSLHLLSRDLGRYLLNAEARFSYLDVILLDMD